MCIYTENEPLLSHKLKKWNLAICNNMDGPMGYYIKWKKVIQSQTSYDFIYEWVKSLSHVRLFATPWTVAYQAPPSMGYFRQEYWSGVPFPSPGDLPDPGIEPRAPTVQVDALTSEPPRKPSIVYKMLIYRENWMHLSLQPPMNLYTFQNVGQIERRAWKHIRDHM